MNDNELSINRQIAVAWIDLTFKIKPFFSSKEKIILNSLNGSVNFGSLNALMGPSGAGKTTLLECINGRKKSGLTEDSKIYLNSYEKIRSCFIGQNEKEYLIMGLTAKQNLIYASKLKNSGHSFIIDHERNALDLLSELNMSDIKDNKVEDCSGGEQKRLSIALEMTQYVKPNVICIDEPTTGLDSNNAEMIMKHLKLLSTKHNIAILTSIHQPNFDTLVMFDRLYALAKGGICVYSGSPQDLDTHLNECQIICSEYQVPIELLLKTATNGTNDEQVMRLSEKALQQKQTIVNRCEDETKLFPYGIPFKSKSFKPIDLWYLLMRTMINNYICQWKQILAQLSFYITFPLIITKVFNSDIGTPDGCYNLLVNPNTSCTRQLEDDSVLDQNTKFHFFTSMMALSMQLTVTTLTFASEVKVFMNEHRNGWYSTSVFFFTQNIVELLPTIIYSIVFSALAFFASGQYYERERLLYYIFIITLGMLCAQGLASFIGIVFVKYELLGIEVAIAIFTFSIMFCNIFIKIKEMPQLFQMISNLSFLKYTYNAGLIIFYGFGRCSSDQFSLVLYRFYIYDELFWTNTEYLIIYTISSRVLAFIALYIKTNTFFKRNKPKVNQDTNKSEQDSDLPAKTKTTISIGSENKIENKDDVNELEYKEAMNKKISIAWVDLTFKVPKSIFRKEKIILRQLNGCVEFGSLNALMGPSGAGKTSLLKTVNGKCQNFLSDQTQIYLSRFKKIRTCFISQDAIQHLINGLKAKEALIYASKLKNSYETVDHENNVTNLMSELLISDIGDTCVENCSGGEQKRLVIAMELTSKKMPNLLCIDEPTSGLDSNAAEVVIKSLKVLSRNHDITVITSIHQPNNDVLMMFDKLYVLSKGGLCIYSGPPQALKCHLSDCDIECTKFQIPIEVLLKHACNGTEDKHIVQLSNKTSEEKEIILTRCSNETKLFLNGIQIRSKRFKVIDFWNLLLRSMTYTYRYNWKLLIFHYVFHVFISYSIKYLFDPMMTKPSGCISFEEDFGNTCNKSIEKLKEESLLNQSITYNFFVIAMIIFLQIVTTTMTFASEVTVFLFEQRNGWYSTGTYYWAKTLVELLSTLVTIFSYIYIIDIYDGSTVLFGYLFFITLGILGIQSLGHLIGIVLNEIPKIAPFVSINVFILLLLFGNFMIPIKELHYALQWFSNISTHKLIFESIIVLLYGFDRCSDTEFSGVLYVFDIDDNTFYRNARYAIIQFILLRSLALFALIVKANSFSNRKKRDKELSNSIESHQNLNNYIPGLTSYIEIRT